MNRLLADFQFSLRLLAKAPGFTVAAIAVLALGIGVNTAIFSLVHELVFSPRPWPEAAQVVQLYTQDEKNPRRFRMFSYPVFEQIRADNPVFTDVMAHNLTDVGLGGNEGTRRTFAALVSSNYFSTLQVPLVRGRAFTAEEEKPGAAVPVAIASYNLWKRENFAPDFVGRVVRVNEKPFTIVGIAPEGFSGTMMLLGPEIYFPLGCYELLSNDLGATAQRRLERADSYQLVLVGRLKDGQSIATAGPALQALAARVQEQFPVEHKEQTFIVRALPRLSTSNAPSEERTLAMLGTTLITMAAIVLLIASLNLANMLLARGQARRKEFAIRLALGSGRSRIVRQLLIEGFLLALAGGAVGFLLGAWTTTLLMHTVGQLAPVGLFFQGATNPALFAATFGFAALATVFFALGPALKLSRADVLTDLKEQAGEDRVSRRARWLPRNPLVVVQLALSLGLLVSAGLFIRAALAAGGVDPGFRADDTLLIELDANLGGYPPDRAQPVYRAAGERLASLPGVKAASIAAVAPFGMVNISRSVQLAGVQPAPDSKPASAAEGLAFAARWNSVGADYFTAMGLPLLRGRAFNAAETDHAGAPAVAIIDEVLARKLFPTGDALGQRIQFAERNAPRAPGGGGSSTGVSEHVSRQAGDAESLEIVGIVPATRWELFGDSSNGVVYVPFAQGFQSNVFFHVRLADPSPAAHEAMVGTIRRELREAAPGVPVFAVKTFRQHLDGSMQLWTVRVGAWMFSVFGVLAMGLAAVGLYGVKAYAVARRTREIGIRLALGAEPATVQRMILRDGLTMALIGAALGLALALGLGQLLRSMLYRVSPFDPVAFTVAPLLLLGVALLACWLPARRATKVDPLTALRSE